MNTFESRLNELLLGTFRDITKVEEMILQKSDPGLTLSEVHLIEAVRKGNDGLRTVSELASDLRITVPSVTVAVNKLVKKGYVVKEQNKEDRRSVWVTLTREGETIYRLNRYVHYKLVRQAASELSAEDKEALVVGIQNMDDFFKKKMTKYGGINGFSNRRNRTRGSGIHTHK